MTAEAMPIGRRAPPRAMIHRLRLRMATRAKIHALMTGKTLAPIERGGHTVPFHPPKLRMRARRLLLMTFGARRLRVTDRARPFGRKPVLANPRPVIALPRDVMPFWFRVAGATIIVAVRARRIARHRRMFERRGLFARAIPEHERHEAKKPQYDKGSFHSKLQVSRACMEWKSSRSLFSNS